MRTPAGLESLIEQGIIQAVVRPLLSGKEAQVYLVLSDDEERVAKVYKDAQQRSFKQRAGYTEGRRSKNSRDQRAVAKGSRHGKAQEEAAWRSAEVDTIYKLRAAGVRVPTPHYFLDGVLVMELVKGAAGEPAPRLGEVEMTAQAAKVIFHQLIGEVVRMLCAGVVHGDLSDFNVLLGTDGPVVIDFPQSIDAAHSQNARTILLRDVGNLNRFLLGFGGTPPPLRHGPEMWDLYARGQLRPDTVLTGYHQPSEGEVDVEALLLELAEDASEEAGRRSAR